MFRINRCSLQFIQVKLTRRVPLVEQELLTVPEHLSSPLVFSGVRVTSSLVFCVCFVDLCLSFCPFFLWSLCCLSFDLQILITPLVSLNSSSHNGTLFRVRFRQVSLHFFNSKYQITLQFN